MKASLEVAQRSETEIFDVSLIISVFNICPCMMLSVSFWKWWKHSTFPVGVGTVKTSKKVNFLGNAIEIASLCPSETSFNQLRFTLSLTLQC